jgi:hypothetical protein
MPEAGAADPPPALLPRLRSGWHALDRDQRLAAFAAFGLFVTMLLPWYQQNAVVTGRDSGTPLVSRNLTAFGVFSFVEAAILLVALAVLALLWARAERRAFHLPGGDGTIIMLAGCWAALLLIWRLFDRPGITTRGVAANVGIQWGIFFALGAAGLLTYAGSRMRARRRPEPPWIDTHHRPPRRRPTPPSEEPRAPGTTVTRVLPPEEPATPAPAPPVPPRRRRQPTLDDQLTIPLDGEEPPA